MISHKNLLLPNKETIVLIDKNYIMASLGVVSKIYPSIALDLMLQSLDIENNIV